MSSRMDREWNRFDLATHGVNMVEYEHHEIHAGSHYLISDSTTLGNGAVIDFALTTPNATKWAHMTFDIEGSRELSIVLYEGSNFDADGTPVVPLNNNRNSSNTSALTVQSDPTVNAAGTQIFAQSKGANRQAGLISRKRELVLKQNTKYLFRITNGSTSDNLISWNADWYEHTNKS